MATTHDPGSVPPTATKRATIADWLAIPEERRAELIDGRIACDSLVTSRAPLAELPAVFERLHGQPDEIKVLIDPRA